jgi:hypothetical protein
VPTVTREDMRQAVVDLLWAQAHVTARVYGRSHVPQSKADQAAPSALDLMAERPIEDLKQAWLDTPASEFGITWNDVASTGLAEVMEQLYDFAYQATVDPRYYPHELGGETGAWWIALFLKDAASSESLFWQREYSDGRELSAAKTLLQIVETANARHLLEGAEETFVEDSQVGYLTIRQLALISDFKEESLRVLANPKRTNALPTQSVEGKTVVDAADARRWLQLKGRYTPVKPKPTAATSLNLALAKFDSPTGLCDALSEHVGAIATHGEASHAALAAVQALFPNTYWQRTVANTGMLVAGLALTPADLQDETRLRALAIALGLDPHILDMKVKESELRASLTTLESAIRAQAERR